MVCAVLSSCCRDQWDWKSERAQLGDEKTVPAPPSTFDCADPGCLGFTGHLTVIQKMK